MNTTLRNTIKNIDRRFFASKLRTLNRAISKYKIFKQEKSYLKKMQSTFKYNNNVNFYTKKQNYLGSLFDKSGSDKGYYLHENNQDDFIKYPLGHGYNDIYNVLFFQHKQQTKLVIECGIGTKNIKYKWNMYKHKYAVPGGSLRALRDYFYNADIIGIDIDSEVMFTEDRISTYLCDQTSRISINSFIKQANLHPKTIDIIIDDGLHEFDANITLFENTRHLLKDNGIYIIEDFFVINKEQQKFIDYFNNLDAYNVCFIKIINCYLIIITKN